MKSVLIVFIVLASVLFLACEEEEAIPLPLPQSVPADGAPPAPLEKAIETAAPTTASPAAPASAAPATPPAPASTIMPGSADQLSSGIYTIQIAVFPSEASAKALVKKMAANGIKAYYAKVSAPDPKRGLCSVYFRVRVGFFDSKSTAENFAKTEIQPLGYPWWVDKRNKDSVGDSDPSAFCGSSDYIAKNSASATTTAPASNAATATAPASVDDELEEAKRAYKEAAKNAIKNVKTQTVSPAIKAPPPPPPPKKVR